jgi:hypothetical protein
MQKPYRGRPESRHTKSAGGHRIGHTRKHRDAVIAEEVCQVTDLVGAGRGGRTPTRLPSADFESVFRGLQGIALSRKVSHK